MESLRIREVPFVLEGAFVFQEEETGNFVVEDEETEAMRICNAIEAAPGGIVVEADLKVRIKGVPTDIMNAASSLQLPCCTLMWN